MPPATSANEPPFALDATVTVDKLQELLSVQTELPWLDFKVSCDVTKAEGLTELVKDIGAMMIQGGYLVVGAGDTGQAVGISAADARPYDQASLSSMVAKYVPPGFDIRSAVHEVDDGSGPKIVALIWVAPHPDGWCIFGRNGDYTDPNGKAKIAFRQGQTYARHGTKSEPWDQTDVDLARRQLVARAKDAWRAEIASELQHQQRAAVAQTSAIAGPAANYTWQLDDASFEAATIEVLRRDDDVVVRQMLRGIQADVVSLTRDNQAADLAVALDRATTLVAVALEHRRPAFRQMGVRALIAMYDAQLAHPMGIQTPPGQMRSEALWLAISERLYAVGAFAVRLGDWIAVRDTILAKVPRLEGQTSSRTWHRHSLTQSSQADLLKTTTPDGQKRPVSLLMFARAVIAANSALHPDLPGPLVDSTYGDDPVLTSLCQFDLLATVISGVSVSAASSRALFSVSYPNFSRFDSRRVGSVVRPLIEQSEERALLLPGATDEQIALVLYLADQVAQKEGQSYWGWEGYHDPAIVNFIDQQVELSDQQIFD